MLHIMPDHFDTFDVRSIFGVGIMDDFDTEYYQLREREELARAGSSSNPSVAAIHRDLAARYAALTRRRKIVLRYFDIGDEQTRQIAKCEVVTSTSIASS